MKRLKLLLTSILIASALLLNGATNAHSQPSSNKYTNQVEANSNKNDASGTPVATPVNQKDSNSTSQKTSTETYNYYGHFNYIPANATQSASLWTTIGQIVSIASTVLVTVFTLALVIISRRQWNVAKDVAEAAKKSAEAAEIGAKATQLALKTNRPILVAESVTLKFNDLEVDPEDCVSGPIKLHFENYGTGPAIVESIVAKADIVVLELPQPTSKTIVHQAHRLEECHIVETSEQIIQVKGSFVAEVDGVEIGEDQHSLVFTKAPPASETAHGWERIFLRLHENTIAKALYEM
jgi:hypothetical protein